MDYITKFTEFIFTIVEYIQALVAYIRAKNDGNQNAQPPEFVLPSFGDDEAE